jgi:hypothetical protein
VSAQDSDLPKSVTFEEGAGLLVALGIASSMTGDAVRYIARTHKHWPFGAGQKHQYGKVANARTLETQAFLAFFRQYPPSGRGPDKQARKGRGEAG